MLEFTTPQDQPTVNFLLYGGPKTGKTVGAASAPAPVLYLNADRPNATRFAQLQRGDDLSVATVRGLSDLHDAARLAQEGAMQTVVVDPIGEVYRVLLEEASGGALNASLPNYKDTGTHLERFCRAMCDAPVNFVIVAHEAPIENEADGTIERLPITGTKNPALGQKLMAMVDVIGYTGVVVEEGQDTVYMAQLIEANGRRGGDRFGVLNQDSKTRPVNLTAWSQEIAQVEGNATPAQPEKEKVAA